MFITASAPHSRVRRSAGQFSDLIDCAAGKKGGLIFFNRRDNFKKYQGYGCWCGAGRPQTGETPRTLDLLDKSVEIYIVNGVKEKILF